MVLLFCEVIPMDLQVKAVHERCVENARRFKESQKDLILDLKEMDQLKGYLDFGCKDLKEYARIELGLSKDVAWTLVTLAKASKIIPAFNDKIQEDKIDITHARMIAPILNPENQAFWLEQAESLSKRDLEQSIKTVFPEKAVKETTRFVAEKRLELKLGVSPELLEKLKRVQDLLSSQMSKAASLEESLEALASYYLDKKDPVQKAQRAEKTKSFAPVRRNEELAALIGYPLPRKPTPAAIKHQIALRDQNQCSHIHSKTGERCQDRRWLHIHHVKPLSHGGQTSKENLITLCSAHHRLLHRY